MTDSDKSSFVSNGKHTIVRLFLLVVFASPVGDAVAGLCDPGPDLMLDSAPTTFATVGDCGSTGKQSVFLGSEKDYEFSIAGGSGINGLAISGEQNGFIVTVQVLELVGGTIGDLQAELTFGPGGISGFFDVLAGHSYILHVIGAGFGNYDIALTAVPLPTAAWLFGSVVLALAIIGRRRRPGLAAARA